MVSGVEDEGDATVPLVMGLTLLVSVEDRCADVKSRGGMVLGSSGVVSGCVGGGGWWRILCWVSSCTEWKKPVGAVRQACWVQEYMPTVYCKLIRRQGGRWSDDRCG
jgi:hypothetical protein